MKNSSRFSAWVLLIAGALAALAFTFAVNRLYESVDLRNEARTRLVLIEEDVAQQNTAAWQAIAEERVSPKVRREVEENRHEISNGVRVLNAWTSAMNGYPASKRL